MRQAEPSELALSLKREYDHLVAARKNVDATWEQIEKFIAPFGSGQALTGGVDEESAQEWQRYDVWDLTAIEYAVKMAASLQSSVISPSIRWFAGKFRDKDLAKDPVQVALLEENAILMWEALQESDFNSEMGSGLQDFVSYGNNVVIEEAASDSAVWEGLDFSCAPLRDSYFTETTRGFVSKYFRRLNWTTQQIVEKFGEFIPDKLKEEAKTPAALTNKHEVVFSIFERPGRKKATGVLKAELRPIGSCYFMAATGDPLGETQGGYYEMPVFVARFQRAVGSLWGHGPGHTALPTVKLVNALCEATLNAFEKALDPPLLARDGGILGGAAGGYIDQRPGAVTPCNDPETDVRALESKARFDLADKTLEDLRFMIMRTFHGDELTLKDSPEMTATEAQIRYELMNRLLGATLARLQCEELDPILMLTFNIMHRAGQLKKMDPRAYKKGAIYFEYQGPLARAQRTDEVASIERLASFAAALMKMGYVEAEDEFDPKLAIRKVRERLGCPADVLRTPRESDKRSKERREMQAQAAQANIAKTTGQAMASMADARGSMPASPPPVLAPTLGG